MIKASFLKISARNSRRFVRFAYVLMVIGVGIWQLYHTAAVPNFNPKDTPTGSSPAAAVLKQLPVKGRAPKTGYSRQLFSDGWGTIAGCDVRNYILKRDLTDLSYVGTSCKVGSGTLLDPYTGATIEFVRGSDTSDDVQIDHVVALGDAWQKGAQQLTAIERYSVANDPLNLLAVDGPANQKKGDSDASSWLPEDKNYRCAYVARQIAVKAKYKLWVTPSEYQAMAKVLSDCPTQAIPSEGLPQNPVSLLFRPVEP